MEIKELFYKYQKPLLKLANNRFGRKFLGIETKEKIVGITDNAFVVRKKRNVYQAVFRTYPLFAKKLHYALASVNILKGDKEYRNLGQYRGLLNYCGLFEQPRLFPQIFLASGDPIAYVAAGTGHVNYAGTATWATARDATTGTGVSVPNGVPEVICRESGGGHYIYRAFTPFDTSVIPSSAVITGAVYKLTWTTVENGDNDGDDNLCVLKSTQASATTLTTADYDQIGTTAGSDIIDSTGKSSSAVTFTLNATGLTWIEKDTYTMLGFREGHDRVNSAIGTGLYNRNTVSGFSLEVDYTVPSAGNVLMFGGNVAIG